MTSPVMVGPVSDRGDKEFGKALKLPKVKLVPAKKPKTVTDPVQRMLAGTQTNLELFDRNRVTKVDTTMSDRQAHHLARQYDTRGPLPKGLSREQRMSAYEARYIAAGGKKAEKWKRRADNAEVGRNIGLAGATVSAAGLLAGRGRLRPRIKATPGLRRIRAQHLETTGLAAAAGGGASELYGEHARNRRASYQNSPAGVAGSALTRMRAYTPEK